VTGVKKPIKTAFVLLLIAAGIGWVVFWWVNSQPKPEQAQRKPEDALVAIEPRAAVPLRPLEEVSISGHPDLAQAEADNRPAAAWATSSDAPQSAGNPEGEQQIRNAIGSLMTPMQMAQFVHLDPVKDFVRRFVTTIDNLPREHASMTLWPTKPMPGRFMTGSGGDDHPAGMTSIHESNATRYLPFVAFIEAIDSAKAMVLYQKLYPVFQQAYIDLGYPNSSFHTRLLEVTEHLISAPVQRQALAVNRVEINGPFRPVRPWVTYEFTDPALNTLSAGQKMLLRTGGANHQRLRDKLIELKTHLNQMPQPG